MKRRMGLGVLAGFLAAWAWADGTPRPIPPGTQTHYDHYNVASHTWSDGGIASGDLTYSDTSSTGGYLGQGSAGGVVSDDLLTIDGVHPIVSFTFGYFLPPEAGGTDAEITFYDRSGSNYPGGGAPVLGFIDLGGLGGGSHVVFTDGFAGIPVNSGSIWMEVAFTNDEAGLMVTGDPGGNVGFSDNVYALNSIGTSALAGGVWSDFYLEVYQTPEPATAALLAAGLAWVARRRRA